MVGSDAAPLTRLLDAHTLVFEPPSLIHMVLRGPVTPDVVRGMASFVRECLGDGSAMLLMITAPALGSVSAETRKTAVEVSKGIPYRGIAFWGVSFEARVVAKLVLGAMRLLSMNKETPVCFLDTEVEARAWIERRLDQLAGDIRPSRTSIF
jgi:hypothetical protein